MDQHLLEQHRARSEARRSTTIKLDPSLLQWTPILSTSMIEHEEKQAENEVSEQFVVQIPPRRADFIPNAQLRIGVTDIGLTDWHNYRVVVALIQCNLRLASLHTG